ncbi:MAG: hypothetical protein KDK23_01910 [Leptospiraceae bacterium]|nr:hypothetical protein [Leptospiraceae bacterium]
MAKETTNVRVPRELFEEAREATELMEKKLGFRPSVSQFVEKAIRDAILRLKAGDIEFLSRAYEEGMEKDGKAPRK